MNLNQVTIPCHDYAASVAFYRRLGFRQIVDSAPHYARFETEEGTTFSLHTVEPGQTSGDFVVYFEVDDVDASIEALRARGVRVDSEPADQRWLWREAYLRDPAGNAICIYHAGENRRFPPWRLEDAD